MLKPLPQPDKQFFQQSPTMSKNKKRRRIPSHGPLDIFPIDTPRRRMLARRGFSYPLMGKPLHGCDEYLFVFIVGVGSAGAGLYCLYIMILPFLDSSYNPTFCSYPIMGIIGWYFSLVGIKYLGTIYANIINNSKR